MHMSINMISCYLFGLLRFALFWHWYTLTFVPSLVASLSLKETGEVCVHCLLCSVVHCFEGFWGNAIEARCLSLLQFVDGVFDFSEGGQSVDGSEAWILLDEIKNSVLNINGSVVVQDLVNLHAEDGHISLALVARLG